VATLIRHRRHSSAYAIRPNAETAAAYSLSVDTASKSRSRLCGSKTCTLSRSSTGRRSTDLIATIGSPGPGR
jgi:hypothetical protein